MCPYVLGHPVYTFFLSTCYDVNNFPQPLALQKLLEEGAGAALEEEGCSRGQAKQNGDQEERHSHR